MSRLIKFALLATSWIIAFCTFGAKQGLSIGEAQQLQQQLSASAQS